MKTIGFIGAGNMGGALAAAACRAGYAENVYLYDKDTEKAAALAAKLACHADTLDAVVSCDMIFLGVKPQFLATLAEEVAPFSPRETRPPCSLVWRRVYNSLVLPNCLAIFPSSALCRICRLPQAQE